MTSFRNRRAEHELLAALVGRRSHAEAFPDTAADGDGEARLSVDGALALAAAIGALRADEVMSWRERFACEEELRFAGGTITIDAETAGRVAAHLSGLIASLRPEVEYPDEGERAWSQFEAGVGALTRVGALSRDEWSAWDDRAAAATGAPSAAETRELNRQHRCTAVDLRRVVLGPEPVAGLRILCAELYGDGVVLHHRLEVPVDADAEGDETSWLVRLRERRAEFDWLKLGDDVGTPYREGGPSGGGGLLESGLLVEEGTSSYTPAVPAEARWLVVHDRDRELRIDLRAPSS